MTGAEHFREADLALAAAAEARAKGLDHDAEVNLRFAEIHARLAQAAATALFTGADPWTVQRARREWQLAASGPAPTPPRRHQVLVYVDQPHMPGVPR